MLQRVQHLMVRSEVSIGNIYIGFGIDYCRNHGDVDNTETLRHASDHLHNLISLTAELRIVVAYLKQRTLLVVPLLNEKFLELCDCGSLYLDIGITPIG